MPEKLTQEEIALLDDEINDFLGAALSKAMNEWQDNKKLTEAEKHYINSIYIEFFIADIENQGKDI